jgi:hypothetical protein
MRHQYAPPGSLMWAALRCLMLAPWCSRLPGSPARIVMVRAHHLRRSDARLSRTAYAVYLRGLGSSGGEGRRKHEFRTPGKSGICLACSSLG